MELNLDETIHSFDELIDLSDREVKKLFSYLETVTLYPGTVIFSEGTKGDSLYIIEDGRIGIYKADKLTGQTNLIANLLKGHVLGEMSFLMDIRHTATAKALTQGSLLKLTREKFNQLYEEEIEICYKILMAINKVLIYRLDKKNKELVGLLRHV